MARRGSKKGRNVSGILVLNKGLEVTSNAALQRVKRMFGAAKAGHTGSLDPLATGVLPICMGEATKFSQFLLDADKAYRVTGKLGTQTASGDAAGEVVNTCAVEGISSEQLLSVLSQFEGDIEQVPSMYSAIKHNGQPLYKLARQGVEVERKARKINIHQLDLVAFDGETFTLDVKCSKGTYIRNLVEDIGFALDNLAFVTSLHRTESGPFLEKDAITVEELAKFMDNGGRAALDKLLMPVSAAISGLPELQLTDLMAFYLKQGQAVQVPQAPSEGWVSLFQDNGDFLGVGEIRDNGQVAPRRLINTS
ncbi:MAG: tRNA pseudouridine(55) synthase TruB [Gammaproteobacteria bacterium]|nr:MAG: tRNA pseudouridine(55) synthase TruB [Gammaproteobacteria bacterium]